MTQNELWKKIHSIRVDSLTKLARHDIANRVLFASEFEDEFVKTIVDWDYKLIQKNQKKNFKKSNKMLAKDKYLDTLCEKVFEGKIFETIRELPGRTVWTQL